VVAKKFDDDIFETQCEDLALGKWTKTMPKRTGTFPVQAVDTPSEEPSFIVIYKHEGKLHATRPWGGWWWTEPLPKFPPTPDYKGPKS